METFDQFLKCVSPFPFASNGALHDGRDREQPKYCRDKCKSRECVGFAGSISSHRVCANGFSCYPVNLGQRKIVLNGLIVSEKNSLISGERRKALRQYVVSEEQLQAGIGALQQGHSVFLSATNDGAKDSVAHYHDIRTSVGVVLSWCERLIDGAPGRTFEEKLNTADLTARNLFASINLLQEQLELADIIANPSAITYGQQNLSSLTGFWYRMVKLFEPRAHSEKASIEFLGHGNVVSVRAYNSIQFLPLILLDNAIKYSYRGRTIYVELSLQRDALSISVSSYGKTVVPEFREKIFEKNVRGPNGIAENPEGMGMGLFIARQISTAHGYSLFYEPPEPDLPVGNNKFVLRIPREFLIFDRQ
ncbi:MAG: sensor histidine kinase [Opitutaceae bacterium]|nr:sensor histidine kinase [Opitutaceae bacterium]